MGIKVSTRRRRFVFFFNFGTTLIQSSQGNFITILCGTNAKMHGELLIIGP